MDERDPEIRAMELRERMSAARTALEPDEMPEPHDARELAPYVFGEPERP